MNGTLASRFTNWDVHTGNAVAKGQKRCSDCKILASAFYKTNFVVLDKSVDKH